MSFRFLVRFPSACIYLHICCCQGLQWQFAVLGSGSAEAAPSDSTVAGLDTGKTPQSLRERDPTLPNHGIIVAWRES